METTQTTEKRTNTRSSVKAALDQGGCKKKIGAVVLRHIILPAGRINASR